jgi:hypothetical protein
VSVSGHDDDGGVDNGLTVKPTAEKMMASAKVISVPGRAGREHDNDDHQRQISLRDTVLF